jgi:hypothetical protein
MSRLRQEQEERNTLFLIEPCRPTRVPELTVRTTEESESRLRKRKITLRDDFEQCIEKPPEISLFSSARDTEHPAGCSLHQMVIYGVLPSLYQAKKSDLIHMPKAPHRRGIEISPRTTWRMGYPREFGGCEMPFMQRRFGLQHADGVDFVEQKLGHGVASTREIIEVTGKYEKDVHRRLRRTGARLRRVCEQVKEFPCEAGCIAELDQPQHAIHLGKYRATGFEAAHGIGLHRQIELALRLFDENGELRTHQIQGTGIQAHS